MEVTDRGKDLSGFSFESGKSRATGGAHSFTVAKASEGWDTFLKSLKKKGYTVLVGMEKWGNVHTSVVLVADLPGLANNLKKDFYAFVNHCDIPFDSGDAYTEYESE